METPAEVIAYSIANSREEISTLCRHGERFVIGDELASTISRVSTYDRFGVAGSFALVFALAQRDLNIKDFVIRFGAIDDAVMAVLAPVLGRMHNLQFISLHDNGFKCEAAALLAVALLNTPHITTVSIASNSIGNVGLRSLLAAFVQMKKLEYLIVRYTSISAPGARALAAVLGEFEVLEHLNMDGNGIGNKGVCSIAEGLVKTRNVVYLSLKHVKMGGRGVSALASTFGRLERLRRLDISENKFGDTGAFVLAAAIGDSLIEELCLNSCRIGDRGACALALAFARMQKLFAVYVNDNSVGDTGACALASMVVKNPVFVMLGVSNNLIGDDGARAFASAIEKSQKFSIYLSYNRIGCDGIRAVVVAIALRDANCLVHIHDNPFGDEGSRIISVFTKSVYCLTGAATQSAELTVAEALQVKINQNMWIRSVRAKSALARVLPHFIIEFVLSLSFQIAHLKYMEFMGEREEIVAAVRPAKKRRLK